MITATELIRYAKTVQHRRWKTKTGKPFYIEVRTKGIGVTPRSDKPREISNKEIAEFCRIFTTTQSMATSQYRKTCFNSSYLIPIASEYDAGAGEIQSPEEAALGELLKEGATKQVHVNSYERSASARNQCIQAHGHECAICGFSFEEKYGPFAAGFIHVHHLNPLAEAAGERIVDPVRDLLPVCPNCHAVIHLRGGCLSISEVQDMIQKAI
jgi:5-methylcytosine-specific restriction protein A